MSVTDFASQADLLPKERFFWRRFGAFLIDWIAVTLVIWLLGNLVAFTVLGQENFSLSSSTYCEVATTGPLVEQIEKLPSLPPDETRSSSYCDAQSYGFQARYLLTSVTKTSGNNTTFWSTFTFVDKDGNRVDAPNYQYVPIINFLCFLLTLSVFAWLISNRYNTPGKKLLGIAVVTLTNEVPNFRSAFAREIAKHILLLATAIFEFVAPMLAFLGPTFDEYIQGTPIVLDSSFRTEIFIASALPAAILAVWWLGPFVFWKGQTYYDRFLGCKVLRTA